MVQNLGWGYGIAEQTNPKSENQSPRLIVSPNPFRGKTEIRYEIPDKKVIGSQQSVASIKIFDPTGRLVKSFSDLHNSGHSVCWFGDDDLNRKVSEGIYFVRLKTNGFELTEKVILMI